MTESALFSLTVTDKAALYASYMPFIHGGGLFVPTLKPMRLGDEAFLLLQLIDEDLSFETLALAGKVVWLTPKKSQGHKRPGVGVQFSSTSTKALSRLEAFLGDDWLTSEATTLTL